jgi:DNA mismatch endonuclease Vsr
MLSLAAQMRHVGNAVPPLMARALRNAIAGDLLASNAHRLGTVVGRPKAVKRTETVEQRSRIMRGVPSKNTSTELTFRKALWAVGIRGYRLHDSSLPGNPDVVFSKRKVVVFIDGCFWHGCPKCYREPATNQKYWSMKVERNQKRDEKVARLCEELGWKVVRYWEHEIKADPGKVTSKLVKLFAKLKNKPATGVGKQRRPAVSK